jgi:phosphoglycolate phosphatase-like HAD superfamily hydrolase
MTKPCFIFDMDGTLAEDAWRNEHMRNGDWDKYFSLCGEDPVIEHVAHIARALSEAGYTIIVVTGRSDSVRAETTLWLAEHKIDAYLIFMRKKGDVRNNSVMKLEALAELRARGFAPLMAFDDQPHTCKMWRDAGVPCAQVKGAEDFIEYKQRA